MKPFSYKGKSPLNLPSPLFAKEGNYPPLLKAPTVGWQRPVPEWGEVRRDFANKICPLKPDLKYPPKKESPGNVLAFSGALSVLFEKSINLPYPASA
ncbi:MAG: hypothetical protein HZA15_06055 [Nitrospirae bacterium]|nr:hypothetical protein [Nitrospirota bacterium]